MDSMLSQMFPRAGDTVVELEGMDLPLEKLIIQRYTYSRSCFASWREQAKLMFSTYACDPLTDMDKERLAETKRVAANFSYSTGTVNAVVGVDQGDRKEVRFVGVSENIDDTAYADWFTRLVRHQFVRSGGHRVDANVLLDLLICGYGWGNLYVDAARWPFQISVEHVDPWNVFPDPDAKDDNLTDAQWVIRRHEWSFDYVKLRWPGRDWRGMVKGGNGTYAGNFPKQAIANDYHTNNDDSSIAYGREACVEVLEYQYIQPEPHVAYTDPLTGQTMVVPKADYEKLKKSWAAGADPTTGAVDAPLQGVEFVKDTYRRAYIVPGHTGSGTLLEDKELTLDEFTLKCATGMRKKMVATGRTTFFGLMAVAYDAQMWVARALSMILEILGKNVKGGWMVEEDAVDNIQDLEQRAAQPGAILVFKPGSLTSGKVQPASPGQWPNQLDMLLKMCHTAIADVTMVSEYLKGTATQERSNVLVSNLQSQNVAALNPILYPMSGYRMLMGRALAKLALATMDDAVIDRILGPNLVIGVNAEADPVSGLPVATMGCAQLLRQQNILDLDVEVDTGAASPTAKQDFWRGMVDTALLQKMMEMGVDLSKVIPLIIKYSPLPADMAAQLSKQLEDALAQPDPQKLLEQLQALPPDQIQMVADTLGQILQQQQQPEGQPEGGEAPPEEGMMQ